MTLEPKCEELYSFLSSEFADADFEGKSDEEVVRNTVTPNLIEWHRTIIAEGRAALNSSSFPWRTVGDYANRYFETEEDARIWLTQVLNQLELCVDSISRKNPT
ncbi:hypothetical protein [Iningainema tapete]|uniref:CdiI immunity protein domain-containing protein n=1 Tax=Iningainema tapete BLCC-T55 TaxID=2748662 RepID=A0A8J7CH64_9CYAN|nr:hypothetical protein [Iningainema tapete]MBD2777255.1 hypothetical protein [Iningainema tapete BLCC-T55]